MSALLSVDQAKTRLLSKFSPLSPEYVGLKFALGSILAEELAAPFEFPLFDNSSMDGYAVISEDTAAASASHPVQLSVVADIPAGSSSLADIQKGTAARVMTGAPLPEGADAVVPIEGTDMNGGVAAGLPGSKVKIFTPVQNGDYIRLKGQDFRTGEIVLQKGKLIRAKEIGLLAMLGLGQVLVHRRPRVAILSTGDELVSLETTPIVPGKIYDSNRLMLEALAAEANCHMIDLGIAPDDPDSIRRSLEAAIIARADLIITTAGVSVGAFDHVRQVVESGGEIEFWRVNMRPGKPLAFGQFGDIPFIGLPGNPVSAFVGYQIFVRPALELMKGNTTFNQRKLKVNLKVAIDSDGRESYLRGIVYMENDRWVAQLSGHQGSGNLRTLVQANALLLVPSGVKSLPIGADIDAIIIE